jgi:hypothetical protein
LPGRPALESYEGIGPPASGRRLDAEDPVKGVDGAPRSRTVVRRDKADPFPMQRLVKFASPHRRGAQARGENLEAGEHDRHVATSRVDGAGESLDQRWELKEAFEPIAEIG